ncbi:MAG: flavin reductase [Sphingobacteriales bacterium]|nr:flavin reductase [Sphingobacteriales bacterium]
MKSFNSADLQNMEQRFRSTLINSISGFKSLQMVGTINQRAITNIALFNSIFHVGSHPPFIGMVVRPEGDQHETLKNILELGVYTLNNVNEDNYIAAHQTSARYLTGESEFTECGFTEEYVDDFKAPFVKESNIKLGLELVETIPFPKNGTTIIIGEVKHIILDEQFICADGYVDLAEAKSVTVAGLDAYHQTQLLGRLAYAKRGKQPEFLNVNEKEK